MSVLLPTRMSKWGYAKALRGADARWCKLQTTRIPFLPIKVKIIAGNCPPYQTQGRKIHSSFFPRENCRKLMRGEEGKLPQIEDWRIYDERKLCRTDYAITELAAPPTSVERGFIERIRSVEVEINTNYDNNAQMAWLHNGMMKWLYDCITWFFHKRHRHWDRH